MNKVLLEIPGIGHNESESVLCVIYSDVWIGSIEMFGPKRQNIYPFRIIELNVNIECETLTHIDHACLVKRKYLRVIACAKNA